MRGPRRLCRLAAVWLCLAAVLTGCGKTYVEAGATSPAETESRESVTLTTAAVPETEAEPEEETEPEERIAVDGRIKSYLTGEMVDVSQGDRRPIAVMMSNDRAAQPQYGINRAGVVYEAPVEGDMNRFMAIIEDYDDLERIGSVRSCRTYYVYFAREFDAIYVHYGQSTFAKPYLKYVDSVNGIEGTGGGGFFRSSDKKAPHNAYASAGRLQSTIEKLGYSQSYDEDYSGHYRFARNGDQIVLENGLDAWRVAPGYAMNQAYFEYNEDDGLYYRYQYGGPHNGDEGPIAVKNILFQYCPVGHYSTTPYLDIDVHTSQYGYYITNGRAVPVTWTKDGELGVTRYYNTENEEITLNQGKTWVCIIPTADFQETEIHGKND